MSTLRSALLTLVIAVLVAGSGARSLSAQSLADVARREEERRKTVKGGKAYTNKDLKPAPAPAPGPTSDADGSTDASAAAASAAAPVADGEVKAAADEDGKAQPVKDEKYWGEKTRALQVALDRDQTYAEALQSRVNALTADFVNRDDPAQRAVIGTERQKALAELDRLRQAIQDDQQAITNLEEEAQRAGVPPGWLR